MPSSTSSSSTRIPAAPYGRLWLAVTLLLAGALGMSEFVWREEGYQPNVSDTKILWSHYRDQVYTRGDQKRIVVVGASRAQLGIDPVALGEAFPDYKVIHLAIDGTPPVGIIEDLGRDEKFDGIILCSATMPMLRAAKPGEIRRDREYVDNYHNVLLGGGGTEKRLNGVFGAYLQSRSVVFAPVLALESLLRSRLAPPKLGQHMRFNRFRPAYYHDRMTPEQLKDYRDRRISKRAAQVDGRLDEGPVRAFATGELKSLGEGLRSRGGDLVLVRMPTSGRHWEIDQDEAPKGSYWDRLQEWSDVPTIHFKDYATLDEFECPDSSHLEAGDAAVFTRNLAEILKKEVPALAP